LENSLIQEAIFHVLKEKANRGSVSDVASYLANLADVRAKDMAKMLFPFTAHGIYNRYFEGRATLSLEEDFFLFEFENLRSKPELQRIVLMIVMFLVFEKMFRGDRKRTISLVIDEAWKLLEGGYFAEFIEGIARRARKYNGNLITGTQSVDDFYKNPAALAVYQNSDWLCLLSQSRESIDAMKKSDRVKLDPEMEKALISLKTVNNQYSEMLVYNSSIGWAVGRLILDPKSIAVYSSKGDDFARIQQLKSEGYSLEEAIDIAANKIKQEQLKRG
jgi:conjugal transfer ATP-binding protein TraC